MAFNQGSKVYICETAAGDDDLSQSEFEALTWVEVLNVGTLPEYGRSQDELTYPTLAHGTIKGKGAVNFGAGDFEVSRKGTNTGRDAMETAAATELKYAMKIVAPDATDSMTATIDYLRGALGGPVIPGGGGDQAKIYRFSMYVDQHLPVAPEAIGS